MRSLPAAPYFWEAIYSLTSGLESQENSPISRKILRGGRMARGAFGRALVKLKVLDTDVRAGGALVWASAS